MYDSDVKIFGKNFSGPNGYGSVELHVPNSSEVSVNSRLVLYIDDGINDRTEVCNVVGNIVEAIRRLMVLDVVDKDTLESGDIIKVMLSLGLRS